MYCPYPDGWFVATPGSLWADHLTPRDVEEFSEKMLFQGFTIYAVFLVAGWYAWRRQFPNRGLVLAALGTALVLALVVTRWGGNVSFWYLVHQLVPGANAFRAVGRIAFAAYMFGTIGGLVGVQAFGDRTGERFPDSLGALRSDRGPDDCGTGSPASRRASTSASFSNPSNRWSRMLERDGRGPRCLRRGDAATIDTTSLPCGPGMRAKSAGDERIQRRSPAGLPWTEQPGHGRGVGASARTELAGQAGGDRVGTTGAADCVSGRARGEVRSNRVTIVQSVLVAGIRQVRAESEMDKSPDEAHDRARHPQQERRSRTDDDLLDNC